jgi:hypothetical protein
MTQREAPKDTAEDRLDTGTHQHRREQGSRRGGQVCGAGGELWQDSKDLDRVAHQQERVGTYSHTATAKGGNEAVEVVCALHADQSGQ